MGVGTWPEVRAFAAKHDLALLGAAVEHNVHEASDASDFATTSGQHAHITERTNVALVMGSEGQGLSQVMLQDCTAVSLPMTDGMESLNVSAAGAIFMALLSSSAPRMHADLIAALARR